MSYLLCVVAILIVPIFSILGMWHVIGWWSILLAPICLFCAFMGNAKTEESDLMTTTWLRNTGDHKLPFMVHVRIFQIKFATIAMLILGGFSFYYFYCVYEFNLFITLLITIPSVWVWWAVREMQKHQGAN